MASNPAVISGLAVHTPIADTQADFIDALLAGRSAITAWRGLEMGSSPARVGGDLSCLDIMAKLRTQAAALPPLQAKRLRRLAAPAPWSVRHSLSMALAAWQDAGSPRALPERIAVIVAGQTINSRYIQETAVRYTQEPDWIDAQFSLQSLDSHHAAVVSELIGACGPLYTVGAACASGVHALRAAHHEILSGEADIAIIVGAIADLAPADLHSLSMMGALATDPAIAPSEASRPFDAARTGFVPSHGGAAIVLESAQHAAARGASIHGQLLSTAVSSDGSHLPQPTIHGQARTIRRALTTAGITTGDVGLISAHATSTSTGDPVELASILDVFAEAPPGLPVIATKGWIGHSLWSAALIEIVAALLMVQVNRLHRPANLTDPIAHGGLDLFAQAPRGPIIVKNAFGFGGINATVVLRGTSPCDS